MKIDKNKILVAMMIGALMCVSHSGFAQCKAKQISKGCRDNVKKPYIYDSFAVNEFTFGAKAKQVEVQFTAFEGVKYNIVFCSSGFDEAVTMNIFDKSRTIKNNRHKLYDSSQGIDSNFWSFDPSKSGNYFIVYDVPPSIDGKEKKGCVVMLISYIQTDEEE